MLAQKSEWYSIVFFFNFFSPLKDTIVKVVSDFYYTAQVKYLIKQGLNQVKVVDAVNIFYSFVDVLMFASLSYLKQKQWKELLIGF